MVSWPTGHRWEDYQVVIYDKALTWLGTLATCNKLRYNRKLYGQFGALLTFSLDRNDPWATVLKQDELHFIKVLRDPGNGTRVQTFAGYQIKKSEKDELGAATQQIEFSFLPLARMASWRYGVPVTGETLETTAKVDNAFKWFVERTLGATAPVAPTTGTVRAFTNFSVAADKSEYPANVALKATAQNLYEFLQLTSYKYLVDWDIYLNASDYPEFETWYPRRGLDRTEGNGVNTECIFTDKQVSFKTQSYEYDTADVVSSVMDNRMTKSVGDTGVSDDWLYRESTVKGSNETTMAVELGNRAPKESWKYEGFTETEDKRWGIEFDVGDKVTLKSIQFGYSYNDTICEITAEIDGKGFELLTLTLGDPVPDQQDNQRGGGRRRLDPEYTDQRVIPDMALAILPVANANVVGVGTRASPDDHQHKLSLTADDTNIMTLTAGVGNVNGAGGIATSVVAGNLIISGAGVLNPHALLSATHNDTTAASVVRGDLVTGQGAAPNTKWARLAVGAANTFAKSDGTDVGWGVAVIGLLGDAGAGSLPDANGKITIGGVNGYSFNAHDNQVDFTGPWYRDSVAGTIYPVTLTDHVLVGRDDQVGAHGGGGWLATWLDVVGDVRVGQSLYATDATLVLYGASGQVAVYDAASACAVGIYNDATRKVHLTSDGSSYFYGGGLHVGGDPSYSLTLYSDSGTTTVAAWYCADGALTIAGGGDITVQSGGDTKWFLDGATGNTTWAAGATLTLEGVAYLPPAAAPGGAGYALVSAAGSPYQLSWSATTAAAHNLLSATHGDAAAAAVADGSLIIGNVTPKWSALAISVPAAGLINHLAVANGETRPSWKALFDATVPTTMAPSDAAAAGTAVVAARRDHTHGAPATWTPAVHDMVTGHSYVGGAALDVFGLTAADTIALFSPSSTPGVGSKLLCTNANGYLRLERLEVYSAAKYLSRTGTALQIEADGYHFFSIGGTNIVRISAAAIYGYTDNTYSCGTSAKRWSTIYGVNGDLTGALTVTGTITGSATGTAAIFQGNVTMASGKTVDGVDISAWKTAYDAHTHNYIKPVQYHAAGYDGDVVTGQGVQTGSYSYYECDYNSDGGTRYYVYTATDSSGTSAAWRRIYLPSKPHYHNVSYDTVASAAP